MIYKQITVLTNTFGSELVADILTEAGSEGVSVYDSADFADLLKSEVIWDYVDEKLLEKNEVVRVCGCFSARDFEKTYGQVSKMLARLSENAALPVGSLEISVCDAEGEDWLNEWKKFYKPMEIGAYAIIPDWIRDFKTDKIEVYINPSTAFGTGEHESTRRCLSLMSGLKLKGATVYDAGCGSGILGIAAAKSGAKRVIAYDIDEAAVKSALSNAEINNAKIEVYDSRKEEIPDVKADVFIANITADVLISLVGEIPKKLKKGGFVILSGIIKKRLAEVESAYEKAGFSLDEKLDTGEWHALRYRYGD